MMEKDGKLGGRAFFSFEKREKEKKKEDFMRLIEFIMGGEMGKPIVYLSSNRPTFFPHFTFFLRPCCEFICIIHSYHKSHRIAS